ncbi:hypothetical protein Tco_0577523 [Tanacetum coccineum]
MDDPNITMEEYIRLEEEKARRRVFNDSLTSEVTLSCEPTVSPLNDNKIDFIISFDESDDEDYTVIYDKNLFSYKIIYVNDLKTDSENDNDKVNMPSFPSSKPTVSYFNDLDFFKDFKNEFPAIVYNDALTSKLDFLTEPTVSPQDIDEFNIREETSLSECDEEERNILYFNDLFPFNVIYPDDSKSDKDNDGDKINIKHSSGGNVINIDDSAYAQRYQYGVSWGIDTAYRLPVQTLLKEIDNVDDMLVVGSDMAEFNKPKWLFPFFKQDDHQVGDEKEVEVLCNFNWLPRELITKDGVLPEKEVIPSLMIFETYVKAKDLDLWHIILNGDFPVARNKETQVLETVPFEQQDDDLKKKLAKNNEAKMVLYNALPKKEYKRIFMCKTAKDIWQSFLITHQGNSQVKDNKIDLLVQQFSILEEESINSGFARFNTIITSLKALDEGFSSKNYVRKFLRALHPK